METAKVSHDGRWEEFYKEKAIKEDLAI